MSTYRAVQPHTKEEAEAAFAHGTREQIRGALLGVTYYVDDWRWVQTACLDWLDRADSSLKWTAIQCLGHLATFHHILDLAIVLPALQAHLSDPTLVSVFNDMFEDIASSIEDTSYFEDHWDELPQEIKETLIEGGTFHSRGKRVRKRNFVSGRGGETRGQGSRDHELVDHLKHHYPAPSSHDWQEYYDEHGRLLRLNLADLGLGRLPAELWHFTSLLELDLDGNHLSSVPAELGQLLNLERLALSQNEFSSVPNELGQLLNLQELYLGENQLSSLSGELDRLINLQTLGLSENRLSSVPAELGQLSNLLTLYLGNNQLRSIPAEWGHLTNLRTLFLGKNRLSSLPAELGQLVHLNWLDLSENQLRTLPAELGQLVHLDVLKLSQNPQLQIPPPDVVQQGVSAILAYLRALL